MASYSSLSERDGRAILARFGWGLRRLEPMHGGAANSSFKAAVVDAPPVVVTVLDNHTADSARRLVLLTDWLIDQGVPTPPVLRDLEGQACSEHRGHLVVVRPFVFGRQFAELSAVQAAEVGRSLRTLHSLTPPIELGLPGRRLPKDWREQLGSEAPSELREMLALADRALVGIQAAGTCLVHGDLFPDNMIWTADGALQLLDWETASVDLSILDLGFTAVGLAASAHGTKPLWESLLRGYQGQEGPLLPRAEFTRGVFYAGCVLMFHRYMRHVVRYPDDTKCTYWKELLPLLQQLRW